MLIEPWRGYGIEARRCALPQADRFVGKVGE